MSSGKSMEILLALDPNFSCEFDHTHTPCPDITFYSTIVKEKIHLQLMSLTKVIEEGQMIIFHILQECCVRGGIMRL